MMLVAGLGNPGLQYRNTRHNMGFWAADALAALWRTGFERQAHRALVARAQVGAHTVLLLKPQTFMNASGQAIGEALAYYKLPAQNLIVLYDDVDLPPGALRIRPHGGAGTHNGMRSILDAIDSRDFARVRIGIGAPPAYMDIKDYVLGVVPPDQRAALEQAATQAAAAVDAILTQGMDAAMRLYNGRPDAPSQ